MWGKGGMLMKYGIRRYKCYNNREGKLPSANIGPLSKSQRLVPVPFVFHPKSHHVKHKVELLGSARTRDSVLTLLLSRSGMEWVLRFGFPKPKHLQSSLKYRQRQYGFPGRLSMPQARQQRPPRAICATRSLI